MILIIGSNHDDVLYYHSIIKYPEDVTILKDYHAVVGTIFNSKVMIIEDVYTSYLSSTLAMYIVQKYFVSAIFCVGKCEAVSDNLKEGHIAVSNRVMFGDLDQIEKVKGTVLGQIPNLPKEYPANPQLLTTLNASLGRIANGNHFDCLFFSSSAYCQDKHIMKNISKDEKLISSRDDIVIDGESAGIALVSYLCDVPFITVKVVEGKAGVKLELNSYLNILRQYAVIGKAVVSCIGEISRQDILR